MPTGSTTVELDADVLQRGWAARVAQPTFATRVDWAARTDIGRVREHNEDKFDFFFPQDRTALALRGRLWAVADGMGGHSAGQIASETALKSVIRSYYSPTGPVDHREALAEAITEANALIYQASRQFDEKSGMGTTLVVAVLRDDVMTLAHVGDSRAYLLRSGQALRPLTTDHSWVEEMVRRGALSRADAEASSNRHYILRSVGVAATVEPEIASFEVETGDMILLCSDGLCGYVGDPAIARILGARGPSPAALDLVDAANEAGGRDNVTALILQIGAIRRDDPSADRDA